MPSLAAISDILSMLACPVCHGSLRANAKEFVCLNCGRSYSVVDGIPVLIADKTKATES
jgi:uncharacterized protein